ncbi:hypothetical protein [Kitasatospora sp. MMS16-BH015]|uniref:hypothetical protein n=1 Tax=Kitasatospora sp. MMS16-BH015 TaxID=2018025 RepID=UPI00131A5A81|nr:hypothetical protein [Kitasatospora sp. MMS16-BH015]
MKRDDWIDHLRRTEAHGGFRVECPGSLSAIYRPAPDRLQLPSGDCLLIDGSPVNPPAARALGLAAIDHHEAPSTVLILENLLRTGERPGIRSSR